MTLDEIFLLNGSPFMAKDPRYEFLDTSTNEAIKRGITLQRRGTVEADNVTYYCEEIDVSFRAPFKDTPEWDNHWKIVDGSLWKVRRR